MKATDVGREMLYPLTNTAIVYAMIFYWLLFGLAYKAKIFGVALLFLTLPAYFRYLLYLLEARANGGPAPAPAIEMFNPADNLWTLTPLIHLAVGIWAGILLASASSPIPAVIAGEIIVVILPASMAVLAVTHSPLGSLNPFNIARMVRACGAAYLIVPVLLTAISILLVVLFLAGVPPLLINLGASYEIILIFSMTGALLHAKNVALQVDISDPVEPDAEDLAKNLLNQRQKVANHAYGFISRGNRKGGFAHIHEWLEKETAVEDAWQWFFDEMLKWENKDPALFFAQEYLCRLLEWQRHHDALKLIARCLHENERWRPLREYRDHVEAMAMRYGREDLLALLKLA
jgi:hypothetical protein